MPKPAQIMKPKKKTKYTYSAEAGGACFEDDNLEKMSESIAANYGYPSENMFLGEWLPEKDLEYGRFESCTIFMHFDQNDHEHREYNEPDEDNNGDDDIFTVGYAYRYRIKRNETLQEALDRKTRAYGKKITAKYNKLKNTAT
jgi:hypothetical protein